MNRLKALYAGFRNHFIKIVGSIGATLLTLDLTLLKGYADQFLTERIAQKVGVALFVLVTARAWYVTWSQRAPTK